MKRLLLILSILALSGCASYYSDPYYSDRYYDRYDRYDGYSGSRYASRPWVYSSWHYDLYDPYSAMFHPMGYLYDPWFWDQYRFGVHRYPSRFWSFSFYGGRPWYYSPWYGGYGLYHPYGYYEGPQRRNDGVPTYSLRGGGEPAQAAARGMAAEIYSGNSINALGNSIVRSSAVRVSQMPGYRAQLLGTMATPGIQINGVPSNAYNPSNGGVPGFQNDAGNSAYRPGGRVSGNQTFQARPGAAPSRFRADDGLPLQRAGFRDVQRSESINGLQVDRVDASTPLRSNDALPRQFQVFPSTGQSRPGTAAGHPWRDSSPSAGPSRSQRSGPSAAPPSFERSEPRSFPSSAPRQESSSSSSSRSGRNQTRSGRDHD